MTILSATLAGRVISAQQLKIDTALVSGLANEARVAALRSSTSDVLTRSAITDILRIQLQLDDLASAMKTAKVFADKNLVADYRNASREIVCYLLEDRKLEAAINAATELAHGDAFGNEWTTAHVAAQLLSLPRPLRPSLDRFFTDTVFLKKTAFEIAAAIHGPEVATDLYLAFAESLTKRDPQMARTALSHADSSRKLIAPGDRSDSRRALLAVRAANLGDFELASNLTDSLSHPEDIRLVARTLAYDLSYDSSGTAASRSKREVLFRETLSRALARARRNPDPRIRTQLVKDIGFTLNSARRAAFLDSTSLAMLSSSPNQVDQVMIDASEALEHGGVKGAERVLDKIRGPFRFPLKVVALLRLSEAGSMPDFREKLRNRAVDLLIQNRSAPLRDYLLGEIAESRLLYGFNEEAIGLVNHIGDRRIAREVVRDIGESTMANLNPIKLRRLADKIESREVKDQVLYRLIISMLLAPTGPTSENLWGVALVDSIRTPDLRLKAKVAVGRFLFLKKDSVASRRLLLAILPAHSRLDAFDAQMIIGFLSALGADQELLDWARSVPAEKATALVAVAEAFGARLPKSDNVRRFVISNGGDVCRELF